jgi:glycosyltransferase involved in cell wall biosynthesis
MAQRIVHVTHTDPRNDSRIVKAIAASNRAGFEPFAVGVAADEFGAKGQKGQNCVVLLLGSRHFRFTPAFFRHCMVCFELYLRALPHIVRAKPRVIHCNDLVVLPLGVAAKFLTGSALVYDAHELESDRNGLAKHLRPVVRAAERSLWPFVDHFITVSQSIADWYASTMGAKPHTVILNSPVLSTSGAISSNYLRTKFGIAEKSPIFIYVGMLARGRGLNVLLRAFAREKTDAHLVFLGEGELSSKIEQLAKTQDRLHLHAPVAHDEVVAVVKSADVGCCLVENVSLSDYFCLPNKLFEYAFACVPVLASDFPEIRRFVQTYQCGVCTQLDERSVAEAIHKLSATFKEFSVPRERLADVSWEAQEQKLMNVYQTLAARAERSR